MHELRFLGGAVGLDEEWCLAIENVYGEDCQRWLQMWWEWEQRWRAAMWRFLELVDSYGLEDCWRSPVGALHHDLQKTGAELLAWSWGGGALPWSYGERTAFGRLGSMRLEEGERRKDTDTLYCTALCAAPFARQNRNRSRLVLTAWYELGAVWHCAGGNQTYVFSTCLLDTK